MSLLSLTFLGFFLGVLIIYYLVPKRMQWGVLLLASIAFYFCTATPYTFVYVAASVVVVYFSGRWIENLSEEEDIRKRKWIYRIAIFLCVGMLAALKYMNFILGNIGLIAGLFGKGEETFAVSWIAALGISFYTLQMVGYLTDIYWGISKSQHNIAKLALFNCYFPQMISGPIGRYSQLEKTLYAEHNLDWKRIYMGFLRILLGFFKKLVISEHLSQVTDFLFANYTEYGGIFVWIGTALYVLEIYADFAGCMDIIMGVSECFGVELPENFSTPFSSTSIQEFWQRWHITLGAWLKDYIMYPILRSELWNKYTKAVKKKWGKKTAKRLPTFTAMLILWFGMGLWHGGGWNYIGEGIWFWLVIVLGQTLDKPLKSLTKKLRIRVEGKVWHAFQCIRTTFIYAVGALFFKAESLTEAFHMLKTGFKPGDIVHSFQQLLPTIALVDSQMGTMQAGWIVLSVFAGFLFMILLGKMENRGKPFRNWLCERNLLVNLITIYILLFVILLLGAYGPGYQASDFIYGGF